MNKKGAEMTIGTIVIIVLAILVLVFLIFGFTTGWGNLWKKIGIYGGDGVNVNDISNACLAACAQNSRYDFCDKKMEIITEEGSQGSHSCQGWIVINSDYGIKECPNICSDEKLDDAVPGEGDW